MVLRGEVGCCAKVVNPDCAGLGGSLGAEALGVPGLIGVSRLEEAIPAGVGLLAAAQEMLGTVLVLLGLALFGRGGTAYTVCFDT